MGSVISIHLVTKDEDFGKKLSIDGYSYILLNMSLIILSILFLDILILQK